MENTQILDSVIKILPLLIPLFVIQIILLVVALVDLIKQPKTPRPQMDVGRSSFSL